ncbi:RxLR-like protein [Plasmopara halstedii]|uniref:RxLR-like protein n=1 Tax=Plasmopara halstedii TaxID=4781 RepID=A0A0P1B4T6_PLAHL|nr:RxLR-like protein [Plasmopara halstedii]CEG49794.1 RxLR-like protein [Plasmopara halstedii]|eukprot:XP_024586163.1 RxLR-like protein [Plasmopara halstedii]
MRLGFIFFVLVALHIASISATTQRTFKPILDSIPEDKVLETKKTGRVKAFAEILSKLRSSIAGRYDSDFRHTSEVQKLLDSSKSAKKWSLGGLTARLKSMRFKLK